jgi:ATP-dependent Clp protease ATP-binding subunit ClpA
MRFEKFTTKLQEALAAAQSNALGQDNQYIEPQHLLLALLDDEGIAGLIAKAGGNPQALRRDLSQQVQKLPKVEGTPGEVHISRELTQLLNVATSPTRKRRSAATSTSPPSFFCSPRRSISDCRKRRWKRRSRRCAAARMCLLNREKNKDRR